VRAAAAGGGGGGGGYGGGAQPAEPWAGVGIGQIISGQFGRPGGGRLGGGRRRTRRARGGAYTTQKYRKSARNSRKNSIQSSKYSPRQSSKKIEVATSSKSSYIKMPIFSETSITLNNIFDYYQYLRFNKFKNAKNLERLFKLLITRNILNPQIGNNLQELVNNSKITDVIEYLENLPEDLSMVYSLEFKDLDEIVKLYLHETDQTLAHDVLQYLIYLKFESKELFDIYVKVYSSVTDFNRRRFFVPRVAYYLPLNVE
jgi:hypothetical protein